MKEEEDWRICTTIRAEGIQISRVIFVFPIILSDFKQVIKPVTEFVG